MRAGFFHVIASLSEVYPQLAVEFADNVCPAVLYCLDETDPSVVHALWLAILHTVSTVPVSFCCFSRAKPLWKYSYSGSCQLISFSTCIHWRRLVKILGEG